VGADDDLAGPPLATLPSVTAAGAAGPAQDEDCCRQQVTQRTQSLRQIVAHISASNRVTARFLTSLFLVVQSLILLNFISFFVGTFVYLREGKLSYMVTVKCLHCGDQLVYNGLTQNGKQRYICSDYSRLSRENLQSNGSTEEERKRILRA
jgi:hypothetical protein